METEPTQPVQQVPQVDYSAYEKDFVFPVTKYTKKEIKTLKVPPRKKAYLLICEVCPCGLSDEKFTKQHIATKTHKLRLKEHALDKVLADLPPLTASNVASLSHFVETTYTDQSALANNQIEVRGQIAENLQSLLRKEVKDVTLQLHGSSVSRFALVNSNVNLNLDIPAAHETQKHIPEVMKKLVQLLEDNADIYTDVRPDYYAFNKIPRILFKHKKSHLLCEVRAMAGNPMMLAPLLQCYGRADERVLKLGVALEAWAKACKLDVQENGHYPGHMFIVMVIHFLQRTSPPIVPVFHEVIPELNQSKKSSTEEDSFFSQEELAKFVETADSWKSENNQTLGELWMGLLRYYTFEFDSAKLAVSIRQLTPPVRETRQWGSSRLAVEDPMIPKSNLARGASSDKVYEYYLSSLKKTTVYFYSHLSGVQRSHHRDDKDSECSSSSDDSEPEADATGPKKMAAKIELEDSSIVFAAFSKSATTSCGQNDVPSFLGASKLQDSSSNLPSTVAKKPSPKIALNQKETGELSNECSKSDSLADKLTQGSPSGTLTSVDKLDMDKLRFGDFSSGSRTSDLEVPNKMRSSPLGPDSASLVTGGVSVSREGKVPTDPMDTEVGQGTAVKKVKAPIDEADSVSVTFELSVKNCVFQPYPTACVNCKQSRHISMECPNDELPDLRSLVPSARPKSNFLHGLGEVFKHFMVRVAPRIQDKRERKRVCDVILNHIYPIYPSAHLKPFGSSANGFGTYFSDLDICLILPGKNGSDSQTEKNYQVEVIETVARQLRKHRDVYQEVVSITTARVPIVKFYLPQWRLECDISMENRLAMRNTKMLAAYASIDERVRILGYTVKHFAKVCDMGDASSGSLSSYAYILLMLHYLQRTTPPVIPVLQKLHPKGKVTTEGPIIDNWDCYYYEFEQPHQLHEVWSEYKMNNQSVGDLWLGFLTFFLEFDWNEQVVTTRQLEPLSKFDKWWMAKHMCVEDPFNLDHNLSASVSGKMRTYILERFRAALNYHSQNVPWQSILCFGPHRIPPEEVRHGDSLELHSNHQDAMLEEVLVGDSRPPKFLLCNLCNKRGHKAQYCPSKAQFKGNQLRKQKRSVTPSVTPGPVFTDLPSMTGAALLPSPSFPHTAVPVAAQTKPHSSPTKVEEAQKSSSRYPNSRSNRSHKYARQPHHTPATTAPYVQSNTADPSVNHPLRAVLASSQASGQANLTHQYQLFGYPQVQSPGAPYPTQYQQYPVSHSHIVPSMSAGHYYLPDQRQYVQNVPRSYPSTPVTPPFSSPLQNPVSSQSAYYNTTAQYYNQGAGMQPPPAHGTSPPGAYHSVPPQPPPAHGTSPPGAYHSVPPNDPRLN